MLYAATAISLPAQVFTTLTSFEGIGSEGVMPVSGLVQSTNGNFYGTTLQGGGVGGDLGTDGTVYMITPKGTLDTLYDFCTTTCPGGETPGTALIQATNGDFYGTTEYGGANGNYGTIFKMTPSGAVSTLYNFCAQASGYLCLDGELPDAKLVQGANGDFYGTTRGGGAFSRGTVFKITPTGALTTLYSFCAQSNCADGATPLGLIQVASGEFYGVAYYGGGSLDAGTIYKISSTGVMTILHSFCSATCSDGAQPSSILQGADGNFYGVTAGGGSVDAGTIYKITPAGTLTTLYAFCAGGIPCEDGSEPNSLVQATDGNFYGTAADYGPNYAGTLFRLTPTGTLTTLYAFCSQTGCSDGETPNPGLIQATNGTFYGTTEYSDQSDLAFGTVFSLSVGLAPFIETQTAGGTVGSEVKILGNNLTGAISVSFNGTLASFEVPSSSFIVAKVPEGATSGTVKVLTPSGTLSSNGVFQVLP
jgi:uncharacterized repeat protein (TIGR03803 family)